MNLKHKKDTAETAKTLAKTSKTGHLPYRIHLRTLPFVLRTLRSGHLGALLKSRRRFVRALIG